jgi:Pyruvate kinase, alpha/beta domain
VETARRLCIAWGLHCVLTEDAHDLDDVVDRAAAIAYQEGFAKSDERIVITAGVPLGTPGATNFCAWLSSADADLRSPWRALQKVNDGKQGGLCWFGIRLPNRRMRNEIALHAVLDSPGIRDVDCGHRRGARRSDAVSP